MPPKTRLQRTFASVVSSPRHEEVSHQQYFDLHEKFFQLQRENLELKAKLQGLEQRILRIETDGKAEVVKTVLQECSTSSHLVSKVQEIITGQVHGMKDTMVSEVTDKIDCQIQFELKEKQEREKLALNVRIGGLPMWRKEGQTFEEDLDVITRAIPTISWDTDAIESIWKSPQNHAVITFASKEDRLRILQQSKLLKGTNLWIAEDLSPNQLKVKGVELQKVKDARKIGKWAVYRDGKALIRDFQPKNVRT